MEMKLDYLNDFGISYDWLQRIFPFYLIVDSESTLIDKGPHFNWLAKDIELGSRLDEYFKPLYDFKELTYEFIKNDPDQECVLKHKSGVFTLKGKAYFPAENSFMLYLPSIQVDENETLEHFHIDNFEPFDQTCDMIFLKSIQKKTSNKNLKLIKKLEAEAKELEVANDLANKAVKAKDTFLANMSHEIRTPLTSIIGYTDLMFNQEDNVENSEKLKYILDNGNHLMELLNDILSLSKLQAGKLELNNTAFNLNDFFVDVYNSLECRVSASQKFIMQVQYPIPEKIVCDDLRLRQILFNLCGNALKFTPQGEVSFKLFSEGERITFEVEDSGIGMSQQELEKCFEAFSQADPTIFTNFGGTGLGLNLSMQLSQLMRGELDVQSEKGSGTKFSFTFNPPCSEERVFSQPKQEPVKAVSKVGASFVGKVLLAEDRPINRKLFQKMLGRLGLTVQAVEDGVEVLEVYDSQPNEYDLIILDIKMPRMGGIEALEELLKRGASCPIIALTANVFQEDKDLYYKSGFQNILSKPIKLQEVKDVMAQYFD